MRCAQRSQPPAAAAVHPDRAYASVSALPALELRALVKDSVRAECKGNFLPPIALDRCSTAARLARLQKEPMSPWRHGFTAFSSASSFSLALEPSPAASRGAT
ncbi:hypothetical protein PF005_g11264 [Phytophthora fragariae]|uniref:Uncharacterized protein n=1 Tax=Phytophthora fragariae TaxID=53985 RepID=A0A6A3XZ95_9STRA|nr:hypothetical protein PF003_g35339 [Phytophthora fragariae]KAE9111611.1 hypothetical protein PF010_g10745 [Phytophthora fragariae]KAE9210796.1 hypothetical protein PF005_g11264 [Phytophthora fragariae]KAE9309534.1 hypothetical protein PF001_g10644 [Phytophthora fragariae]